ncbi:MAG: pantoate--beta-alanine ligase [Akkermansiaceae bacterium]|jgi:pantoate--beta-alanine ligase|nr:pantoate--beta-alanine ligase [Akkermansiaceae bacterium]
MRVVKTGADLRQVLDEYTAAGCRRVLVPTMGALHHGHLELVRHARMTAGPGGTVIVSIFVNPIQFDRANDLDAYPRPVESDLEKCLAAAVDVVFLPEVAAMYHADRSVTVAESLLSKGLCGASRPGHFDGVCTVVLKLFLLSGCDAAVFGEKDFQQLAIIRRMVRDLDVPVEILECPTVRESDGLAMSSRNVRLNARQRADAPRIHRALAAAGKLAHADEILAAARAEIEASPFARIDYLELVDAQTLQPVTDLHQPAVLAAAVFYGEVRLIDHVAVPARKPPHTTTHAMSCD